MVYGTPFEQLEDEDKTAITKRPKGIQDEIVTDERGKRRFHGAFTGGFSAGYFNSVGTKHGWVPQTFKSSREDRADKQGQVAEDFMDDEDLGEFGIAAKKLRTRVDFMDSLAGPGEKRLLAWERSATTSSAAAAEEETSLAHRLTGMLRPVNDSVGVRILKKMGWRPGKGIGAKMTRRALERQKVLDAKSFGKRTEFDEQTVQEVEQHVPGAEFSPDDISIFEIRSKEDVHGLGYRPLQESGVLSEKYGVKVSTLKTAKKSKGIRGQAFGVGAFEEEDEDIYMDYDLSQYDFEVGASSSKTAHDVPKFDSTFVPASASAGPSRKYFLAPTVPSGWRPNPGRIKTLLEKRAPPKLTELVAKACEQLTPFQRAKLLGERDHSVMEMLSSADRERLRQLGGKGRDKENASSARRPHELDNRGGGGGGRGGRRANEAEPFEEEPMKAHRFRQYVAYLKRGIPFPQPVDMTRLEWEKEQEQFQDALPPDLRALLPEVRDRQKPLAKIDFAKPIAEHLKSRFARESGAEIKYEPATTSADPKVEAVRNKQFGQATRQKHVWHPAKELCKRFNVPNPFPDSQIIGTPGLSKMSQRNYEAEYSLFDVGGGLRDTASEVASRRHPSRFDQHAGGPAAAGKEQQQKDIKQEPPVEGGNEDKKDGLAPMSLLSAIFGEDDKDGEEAEQQQEETEEQPDEEEEEVEDEALIRIPTRKQQPEVPKESAAATASNNSNQYITAAANAKGVVTVFDVPEDEEDVYGPAMPPQEFLAQEFKVEEQIKISETTQMITIESDDDGSSSNSSEKNGGADEDRRRRRSKKKSKKEKKHSKKSKKAKKEKRKHRNASGSD